MQTSNNVAILLVCAPDRKGLTAFFTDLIYQANGNIVDLQQHVDQKENIFFMRLVWDLGNFQIARADLSTWLNERIPEKFKLKWQIHFSDEKPRMAIFVSKESHCLYDIISRLRSNEWSVELPLIISNHNNLQSMAERYGIPFQKFDITKTNKISQDQKILELLRQQRIDLVVLARYMQILTESLIQEYENRIINIHHSFLPAFPGSKPYHFAFQRGVKIIGATSHYVTRELDAGPIIAQDVITVNHLDSVDNFISKGRDIEKLVLSRAISAHIQRKILVSNNRTIVFY